MIVLHCRLSDDLLHPPLPIGRGGVFSPNMNREPHINHRRYGIMRHLICLLIAVPLLAMNVTILEESDRILLLRIDVDEPQTSTLATDTWESPIPWWSAVQYHLNSEDRIVEPLFSVPLVLPTEGELPRMEILERRSVAAVWQPAVIPADVHAEVLAEDYGLPGDGAFLLRDRGRMRSWATGDLYIFPYRIPGKRLQSATIRLTFSTADASRRSPVTERIAAPGINAIQGKHWQQNRMPRLERSVSFPAGEWYRLTTATDAVYRISAASFPDGVPDSDPRSWQVFAPYFQGQPLPKSISEVAGIPENLMEIAVHATGTDDGTFNGSDQLLFFAQGARAWYRGNHTTHPFANEVTYWLFIPDSPAQDGLRVKEATSLTGTPDAVISSYAAAWYHESELLNILHTGPRWVGESMNGTSDNLIFIPELSYVVDGGTVTFNATFLGTLENGNYSHQVDVSLNNWDLNVSQSTLSNRDNIQVNGVTNSDILGEGSNLLRIDYSGNSESNTLYLDSLLLQYPRRLAPDTGLLLARLDMGAGVTQLSFQDITTDYRLWDITDPQVIHSLSLDQNRFLAERPADMLLLGFAGDQIQEAILESAPDLSEPLLRRTDIQADYIIITPDRFADQAERIREIREELIHPDERMSVTIAPLATVYDEFSAGVPDPMAIKYFLHYAYYNWQSPQIHYVLLLGDADYDYRNLSGQGNTLVPTWQVDELDDIYSYATDDQYVYLAGGDVDPDLAIGRLPAGSVSEMVAMVDKLESYLLTPEPGIWRNTVTLVGDDPQRPRDNEPQHINQSETFGNTLPASMTVNKIYLTEYPEEQDPSSPYIRKPAARDDLLQKIYNGSVLVNFMGHGSPRVWAQEEVFTNNDLAQVNTGMKLPLWVAGTCDWGKFDDLAARCVPEELLIMPSNGAIGAISSTRKSYSAPNYSLFLKFYERLFPSNTSSSSIPVGDALMIAKSLHGSQSNDEKYVVFADPALKLASPSRGGRIDELDPPGLQALSTIHYTGRTDTLLGSGARAVVTVYDTPQRVSREYAWPEGFPPLTLNYTLPGRRVFRGQISIEGDQYSGEFTIPRDIRYTGTGGILNVQYWDDSGLDGVVYLDTLVFSGSDSTQNNTEGPAIAFTMLNTPLMNGDQISANEPLVIELNDPQGINLTGVAGHGISLAIDGDWTNALDLTELFEYDLDRIDRGRLSVVLSQIDHGEHDLTLKAWDNFNNPNTAEIRLLFFSAGEFKVFDVYNFPNPMQSDTDFTFMLSHPAEVRIDIHTLSGRRIRRLDAGYLDQGFNAIPWDGTDTFGNRPANGVYLYIIHADSDEMGSEESIIEKLVIAR